MRTVLTLDFTFDRSFDWFGIFGRSRTCKSTRSHDEDTERDPSQLEPDSGFHGWRPDDRLRLESSHLVGESLH